MFWGCLTCLLLAGSLGRALAGVIMVPVPGVSAGSVVMVGAQRTADGGALIAALLSGRHSAAGGRLVTFRLLADGAPDLAYGTLGVNTLPAASHLRPTALTINPASGATWLAARSAAGGATEIIALDGSGGRAQQFGSHGVLPLAATDAGGAAALAWSHQALLVADGAGACSGCQISLRAPSTGRLIARADLTATILGSSGCAAAVVSGAVMTATQELISFRDAGRQLCHAGVLVLDRALRPSGGGALPIADAQATATQIAAEAGATCLAVSDPSRIQLIPVRGETEGAAASIPRGRLLSLVPSGRGSCAVLLAGARRATVVQTGGGARQPAVDHLPSGFSAMTMFRCHRHLLVVGTRPAQGQAVAVIVPVTVRRGRFADTRAAAAVSTGCT